MRRAPKEPCTINGDVVVETLLRLGYPNMAEFVQHLNVRVRDANIREGMLRASHAETLERLHVYEPPNELEPVSYKPPPEASD